MKKGMIMTSILLSAILSLGSCHQKSTPNGPETIPTDSTKVNTSDADTSHAIYTDADGYVFKGDILSYTDTIYLGSSRMHVHTIQYNEWGEKTHEEISHVRDDQELFVFEYDDQHRLTRRIRVTPDGEEVKEWKYMYAGNLLESFIERDNPDLTSGELMNEMVRYEYDEQGRLSNEKWDVIDQAGNPVEDDGTKDYTYNEDGSYKVVHTYSYGDTETSLYDAKGHLLKEITETNTTEYQYDPQTGLETSRKDEDGWLFETTYQFDDHGNWIEKQTKTSFPKDMLKPNINKTIRTIVYKK